MRAFRTGSIIKWGSGLCPQAQEGPLGTNAVSICTFSLKLGGIASPVSENVWTKEWLDISALQMQRTGRQSPPQAAMFLPKAPGEESPPP